MDYKEDFEDADYAGQIKNKKAAKKYTHSNILIQIGTKLIDLGWEDEEECECNT